MSRKPTWTSVVLATGAYGWWVAGLAAFTWAARAAVALPIVVVLARTTTAHDGRREVRPVRPRAGPARWWLVLWSTLAAVQLYAYFSGRGGPRRERPTLSWILGHVDSQLGITLLFVAWALLGAHLARR